MNIIVTFALFLVDILLDWRAKASDQDVYFLTSRTPLKIKNK
jgi:hypothetical protein